MTEEPTIESVEREKHAQRLERFFQAYALLHEEAGKAYSRGDCEECQTLLKASFILRDAT